jgi:hypothetical protein
MEAQRTTVLDPELVMPDQFFSTLSKQPKVEGERRLMLAVLEDAVSCYQRFALARDERGRHEFAEARAWIESADREWPFSYENVCDVLGIDPAYVRDGLNRRVRRRKSGASQQGVAPYIMPLTQAEPELVDCEGDEAPAVGVEAA